MYVTGVPAEGKRISLGYGLSIHLPYGAVYAKNEDDENQFMIRMLSPIPGNYRAGSFSIDDDDTPLWNLGSFRRSATFDCSESSEDEALDAIAKNLKSFSEGMSKGSDTAVTEDDKRKDSWSEDADGSVTFSSSISIGLTGGGEVGRPVKVSENVVYCTADLNLRIGREGKITYRNLVVGTLDYPGADIRMAFLNIPNDAKRAEILERRIGPVLKTLELDRTKMGVDIKEPARTPEEKVRREEDRQKKLEAEKLAEEARNKAEAARAQREAKAAKKRAEAAKADAERKIKKQQEIDEKYQRRLDDTDRRLEAAQREIDIQEEAIAALCWEQRALGLFDFKRKNFFKTRIAEENQRLGVLSGSLKPLRQEREGIIQAHKKERLKLLEGRAAYVDPHKSGGNYSQTAISIANQIALVISSEAKTVQDINAYLGTNYTALQVAHAVKFISGISAVKAIRLSVNEHGLKREMEYTAYCLESGGDIPPLSSKPKSEDEQKELQFNAALHRCKAAREPAGLLSAAASLRSFGDYEDAASQADAFVAQANAAKKK